MSHETAVETQDDGVLRAGADSARLLTIVERAMDGGRLDGDELRIGIPVEADMAYWGRSEWHITPEGYTGKAHELFGALLSDITGLDIVIHGLIPAGEDEGSQQLIMATVRS